MEIVAITLARIAAFLEVDSLDPKGHATLTENLNALTNRYGFEKFPVSLSDMDIQKGIEFAGGRLESVAIDRIQIFPNGIIVDTRSSTDDSMKVFDDILALARQLNGAKLFSRRYHLISQIVFRSELKLALLNPLLQPIATRLTASVSANLAHSITFEPKAVLVGPETWGLNITPTAFSIERRANTPITENMYFSAAPLPTSEHIQLIEEIEKALSPK